MGMISAVSFLFMFFSVTSILIGCVLVQLGKKSRLAFALHIVFAVLACFATHFRFAVPLVLGMSVAATALIWPPHLKRVAPADSIKSDFESP
jgi:hypothetical protein